MTVRHPFPGAAIGYTFAQHKEDGYLGGDDYIVAPDKPYVSPCAGTAVKVSSSEVEIRYNATTVFGLRELKSTTGKFPRRVQADEEIGRTGRRVLRALRIVTLWPHIDAEVNGRREPFAPHVTKPSAPAGNPGKPITPEESVDDMRMIYCADPQSWDLIGEHTRQALSSGVAQQEALVWGSAVTVTAAQRRQIIADVDARAAAFRATLPAGGTVDLSGITKLITDGFKNAPAAVGTYVVNAIRQVWSK